MHFEWEIAFFKSIIIIPKIAKIIDNNKMK
jgi:hypothetical protein